MTLLAYKWLHVKHRFSNQSIKTRQLCPCWFFIDIFRFCANLGIMETQLYARTPPGALIAFFLNKWRHGSKSDNLSFYFSSSLCGNHNNSIVLFVDLEHLQRWRGEARQKDVESSDLSCLSQSSALSKSSTRTFKHHNWREKKTLNASSWRHCVTIRLLLDRGQGPGGGSGAGGRLSSATSPAPEGHPAAVLGGLQFALDGGVGLWTGSWVVGILRQRPRSGNFGHLWGRQSKWASRCELANTKVHTCAPTSPSECGGEGHLQDKKKKLSDC